MYKSSRTPRSKRLILPLILVAVLLLGSGAYALYRRQQNNNASTAVNNSVPGPGQEKIDYNPPTETDKTIVEDNKDRLPDNTPPPPDGTKRTVTPVIVSSGKDGISGYISGVIENDGTCTATAKNGGQTITKSTQGFSNASNTQCPSLDWDTALTSGLWTISLSYSSATAQGSAEKTLEVK